MFSDLIDCSVARFFWIPINKRIYWKIIKRKRRHAACAISGPFLNYKRNEWQNTKWDLKLPVFEQSGETPCSRQPQWDGQMAEIGFCNTGALLVATWRGWRKSVVRLTGLSVGEDKAHMPPPYMQGPPLLSEPMSPDSIRKFYKTCAHIIFISSLHLHLLSSDTCPAFLIPWKTPIILLHCPPPSLLQLKCHIFPWEACNLANISEMDGIIMHVRKHGLRFNV